MVEVVVVVNLVVVVLNVLAVQCLVGVNKTLSDTP